MHEKLSETARISTILTIGEVARRSGVAVSTLHFYEAQGLITSTRSEGNQRRFAREVLRRVAFIRTAQSVGIALAVVRGALQELPAQRTPTRADWARLSALWREDLDARIRQLKKLRDALDDCIGCGCLSIERCRLRNSLDRLGEKGSGAHRLAAIRAECAK